MTTALAMSADLLEAGGTAEDRLLAASLEHAGCKVEAAAWSDADAWNRFASVLVRSCWDYHLRPVRFFAWLDRLESLDVPVLNPVPLLRWNVDKRYLLDLAERGLPVVPTTVRQRVEEAGLSRLRARWETDLLVVKPVIGATAHRCRRIRMGDGASGDIATEADGPWLVQPFVAAIVEEGEWSLMLFDGELSHAVLKRPVAGEFRVQKEWGGTSKRVRPTADLVALAERTVAALDPMPAYARVDMARWKGEPHLMELELIEPELFLEEGDAGLASLVERLAAL